jgi:hypothetical protein
MSTVPPGKKAIAISHDHDYRIETGRHSKRLLEVKRCGNCKTCVKQKRFHRGEAVTIVVTGKHAHTSVRVEIADVHRTRFV